jgi:hypothetical protein
MTIQEHIEGLAKDGLTLKDLIDAYVTEGGIIGVGLITLEDQLVGIVRAHHKAT